MGVRRSLEFPVGRHNYHLWLNVDRRLPLKQLDCELGPAHPGNQCDKPPLLDLEWNVWDGTAPVKGLIAKPIQAASWSESETGCLLGGFEGRRSGMFTLELTIKKDAGGLKEFHPRT